MNEAGAQPALWTRGPIHVQRGPQRFPVAYPGAEPMRFTARHVDPAAAIFVDGRKAEGQWTSGDGTVDLRLAQLPPVGMHFLQMRNPDGRFSNELPFMVGKDAGSAGLLLHDAVLVGDRTRLRNLLAHGAPPDAPDSEANRPLHLAAFLGRAEMVRDLVAAGADPRARNRRKETPRDVAMARMDSGLEAFARAVADAEGFRISPSAMRQGRAQSATILAETRPRVGALPPAERR